MSSVKLAMLSLAALLASAAPAMAWDHYRGGYGGYHHSYYPSSHVVYVQPATQVVYAEPVYSSASYSSSVVHCSNSYNPVTGIAGTVLGGVAGNSFGKGHGHTAAIITGAVLGGTLGGVAGSTHCTEEVAYAPPVVQQPVYMQASSRNVGDRTEGRYCREYQNRSTVGGRVQETYGTACMQPDGSWEIVD